MPLWNLKPLLHEAWPISKEVGENKCQMSQDGGQVKCPMSRDGGEEEFPTVQEAGLFGVTGDQFSYSMQT